MGDLQAVVVALTGLIAAVGVLATAVMKVWQKVSHQGREFSEFYEAHLLRGKVEALQKGLAVEYFDTSLAESPGPEGAFMPLSLRANVHKMYDPIRDHLESIRERNPDASEVEMGKLIERRFGGWLARNICSVLNVNQFSCVEMAISVADGIPHTPESTLG